MDIIKGSQNWPLVDESDEDLLVIISIKDDPKASNQAFEEFHRRYKRFIFGMAIKLTSNLPNSEELRDAIFQNTLINVYKYCDSFSVEGEKDEGKIKKRIHGWLVRIAKNELLGLLRNKQVVIDPSEIGEPFAAEEEEVLFEEPSYDENIVNQSLKILSERDQHIFMTYWLYYDKGEKSQAKNLPPDILKELSGRYETTPENIRQIISRSKKKVFDFLKLHYKVKKK